MAVCKYILWLLTVEFPIKFAFLSALILVLNFGDWLQNCQEATSRITRTNKWKSTYSLSDVAYILLDFKTEELQCILYSTRNETEAERIKQAMRY
jgi:hypothetical protein